ncbi:T9SS type A sorting domain-containing protein [Paraflavitalea speifideaquila]|uniref:T9SS type A sorting domain-containing protein n=1 Tax=Paraflavitalea speifideaquila TaxID=3076558 RepID=UPI0028E89C1C|nr:T9SS type A sorting domain-containing protein [Paraflavitalea speifideiaquila]
MASTATYNNTIDLSNATAAYLSFWVRHRAENSYDKLQVQVSTGGGFLPVCGTNTVAENVGTLGSQPALTGMREAWTREVMDLRNYLGNAAVSFRFRFTSNGSNNEDGFYIDNIEVVKSTLELLPVQFISIAAVGSLQGALISWEATIDNNHDHFEIERSVDGVHFATLGRVGKEVANRFIDAAPEQINYYRVRAVDQQGKSVYSRMVSLEIRTSQNIVIYPNPVDRTLYVRLNLQVPAKILVTITDMAGRVQYQQPVNAGKGITQKQVDVGAWPSQVYLVKTSNLQTGVITVFKMIKDNFKTPCSRYGSRAMLDFYFNCKSIPMKTRSTILIVLILLLLLWGMAGETLAQGIELSKSVANITTSSNGTSAVEGDVLEYTIIVKNMTGANLTASTLYDNIPAGSAYIAGTTLLNGGGVADVSGRMPYANTGGLIKSPPASTGVLIPGVVATVKFRVRITANGGNVSNFAMLECNSQGTTLAQSSNTVFTNLTPDPMCSIVYQSTAETTNGIPQSPSNKPYRYIKTVNTTNGTAGPMIYDGANGPCFNAVDGTPLPNGSVLTYASALAYDKKSNRIYFVNNYSNIAQDLSYIDLNASPVCARQFVGFPLETNLTNGWNINRMSFCSDGFGYAVTQNGRDLIRFSINGVTGNPDIVRLGALINDVNNGANNILAESGGDIFGDGSGNLYLIANSSNLYKINPNTRVSTFLGGVNPFPGTSNSMAVDPAGNVYIGGAYRNVFNVNLATMGVFRL